MSPAISHEEESQRIFLISALGSILLHGIIIGLLPLTPKLQVVEKTPPRVQVQLVQKGQEQVTPQPPQIPPPKQPAVASTIPPPLPFTRPKVPASMAPEPHIVHIPKPTVSPPRPLPLKKPVLKDSRTARALQARELMKLASPSPSALPAPSQQQPVQHQPPAVPPPITQIPRASNTTAVLPPPLTKAPQALQASPPVPAGGGITKPILLASSKPLYPHVAREAGWEGTVIIRILIDTEGIPQNAEIRKSSGHPPLDQSALEAIKTWKFRPAKDGNIPISKWVDIPIKFDLEK